jgi:RNA polymerase sigma factor (sigma-70 family)
VNSFTDQQLLRLYVERRSEAAFAEIVRRHVDFIYSAALRMVRDTHLAEDVTQGVFIALAKNARQLADRPVLTGWLHCTARNLGVKVVRSAVRRRAREQEATAMNGMLFPQPDVTWGHIAPHLDAALGELNELDRDAVLLRYFEGRSAREMAQTLGTSEEAAQKRVSRAVERLREFFAQRGITIGASGLAALISANAIQTAPAGLLAAISGAALGSVPVTSGAVSLLKLMTTTKLKVGIITAVIVAGVFITVLWQRNENRSTAKDISSPSSTSENTPEAGVSPPSGGTLTRRARPAASAEDRAEAARKIVSEKMSRFGRSRRDIVRAMSRQAGTAVPNEIEQFFDAVDAGNWEEINTRWQALAKRSASHGDPKDHWPELDPFWPAVLETWGVAKSVHDMPAQQLLDYGETIAGALRPGMVYLGGTDYGRFVPTLLNETSDGQRHIVLTQSQLIDDRYLDYIGFLYGDQISLPTREDAQRAWAEYLADYQKRMTHDLQFPDEPKQVRPGENVTGIDPGKAVAIDKDKARVTGAEGVAALIDRLLKMLMEKNPDLSFAMEQSHSLPSVSGSAAPLGPLLELGVQDRQNAFSQERAIESVDYWRAMSEKLISNPEAADSLASRLSYAKAAADQADLLLKRGYPAEAEQTLRFANEISPHSPEAFHRLLHFLVERGRLDEARALGENALRTLPSIEELQSVFGNDQKLDTIFRNAIEEVKKVQKQASKDP